MKEEREQTSSRSYSFIPHPFEIEWVPQAVKSQRQVCPATCLGFFFGGGGCFLGLFGFFGSSFQAVQLGCNKHITQTFQPDKEPRCFSFSSFPMGILNPNLKDFPTLLSYNFTRWITHLTMNRNLPVTAVLLIFVTSRNQSRMNPSTLYPSFYPFLTLLRDSTYQFYLHNSTNY